MDIQKRPSSVKKVDQALETLMDMIEDSKSTIKSFTFGLNQDWETLEWTITYEDDSWHEYEKTASINIKDIVEWWQVITLGRRGSEEVVRENLGVPLAFKFMFYS